MSANSGVSGESGESIVVSAPAKLNFYLHVLGRRDTGYHDLDSLVVFAAVGDVVSVHPAAEISLQIDGPFADDVPGGGDNLVLRAAEALAERTGMQAGAAITLTKNLPVASGIGGGSADAAATIKALVRLWGVHPGTHDLSGLALDLGADVPVCLFGRPAFMGGIGEQLEPAPDLPDAALVLVNPGVAVSTPEVFGARVGDFSSVARFEDEPVNAAVLADVLRGRGNDLSAPAMKVAPKIGEVISVIEATDGCLLARMSGSGATCFGLYETMAAADSATHAIQAARAAWWATAARLL